MIKAFGDGGFIVIPWSEAKRESSPKTLDPDKIFGDDQIKIYKTVVTGMAYYKSKLIKA